MYYLNNEFARIPFGVLVVGCGGTGGYAAEGLCRLLPARASLVLVDPDRVEEGNLIRQNFFQDEVGEMKSEALAHRLARRYRRSVAYSTLPIGMFGPINPGIVLGCVDNGIARRDIARVFEKYSGSWWLDSGNGDNYGQILIGNAKEAYFNEDKGICIALPLPIIQRPELLSQPPAPLPGCAELSEQGPTINQVMAALLMETVRRIIEGTCPWMQLLLDMQTGELHPVMVTPEVAVKIIGKKKTAIKKGGDK